MIHLGVENQYSYMTMQQQTMPKSKEYSNITEKNNIV